MDPIYLLHVTDLHIDDPKAENVDAKSGPEWLRVGKYKEYLDDLAKAVRNEVSAIHGVVITGDFVNFGKTEHLGHAETVINYLLSQFNLAAENAPMCLGNHDVKDVLEQSQKWEEARADVNAFRQKYANGTAIHTVAGRAVLCKPNDRVWCLMIDSLRGAKSTNAPGPGILLLPHEPDSILELVRLVPDDELLVIGTHYTADPSVGRQAAWEDEQEDWYQRHVWTDVTPIRERIHRVRKPRTTVWLCGDIHRAAHEEVNGILYVTTGRLGTRTGKKDSPILRQAKVVEYSDEGLRVLRVNHLTSDIRAQYGDWRAEWVDDASTEPSKNRRTGLSPDPIVTLRSKLVGPDTDIERTEVVVAVPLPASRIAVINETSEEEILRILRDKRLCKWGRFTTSRSEVLLSWVSIGPLLNVPGRLGATVDEMESWIRGRLTEVEIGVDECLLIGLDCWGAVLASQLSVLSGTRNYCIAARGRGEYHTAFEGVNSEVIEAVKRSRAIVLVNDAVATGRTQRWVFDAINSQLEVDTASQLRWYSLSVFTDPEQLPVVDCSFILAHGTACRLKRPFLPSDRVPDDDMIPNELSLV